MPLPSPGHCRAPPLAPPLCLFPSSGCRRAVFQLSFMQLSFQLSFLQLSCLSYSCCAQSGYDRALSADVMVLAPFWGVRGSGCACARERARDFLSDACCVPSLPFFTKMQMRGFLGPAVAPRHRRHCRAPPLAAFLSFPRCPFRPISIRPLPPSAFGRLPFLPPLSFSADLVWFSGTRCCAPPLLIRPLPRSAFGRLPLLPPLPFSSRSV